MGGIDSKRFLKEVPEYLTCPVCMDVLLDPHTVCLEEHVFCLLCAGHDTCPTCRSPVTAATTKACKTLNRILGDFELLCINKEEGCEWTGTLSNEAGHMLTCPMREIECTNSDRGCPEMLRFKDLKGHLDTCAYDWTLCPRGGNDCGPALRRSLAAAHDDICDKWKCEVSPVCTTTGTKAALEIHRPGCQAMEDRWKKEREKVVELRRENMTLKQNQGLSLKDHRHRSSGSDPLSPFSRLPSMGLASRIASTSSDAGLPKPPRPSTARGSSIITNAPFVSSPPTGAASRSGVPSSLAARSKAMLPPGLTPPPFDRAARRAYPAALQDFITRRRLLGSEAEIVEAWYSTRGDEELADALLNHGGDNSDNDRLFRRASRRRDPPQDEEDKDDSGGGTPKRARFRDPSV